MSKTVLFQTVQFSIQKFNFKQFSLAVLYQVIQFSISTQFCYIWHIDRTQSGSTTPVHKGPGSDGSKGILLYSHLHHHSASQRHNIKDRRVKENARRKTQEDFFTIIFTSRFIARFEKGCSRVACERMLETEHKLHILTPLLWPSRCVFLVLLDAQPEVLGSTPSGFFRGPPRSGVAFPTTSGVYCLEVCWQLLWDPNSTELNNNSTPTRSPTGSLQSNV